VFEVNGGYDGLAAALNEAPTAIERDKNLMFVYAVEGYSQRHNMTEKDVIDLFRKHGVNTLIRDNYDALHTQDLDESISFAEDVLSWKQN
jgi:hypothetical protein